MYMGNLEKKIWEERAKIAKEASIAAAETVGFSAVVALETAAHLCPAYWIYKAVFNHTNPFTHELESVYLFDHVGDHVNNIKDSLDEIQKARDGINTKKTKDETVSEEKNETHLKNRVLEFARLLIIKCNELDSEAQKAFTLKIKDVLADYGTQYKILLNSNNSVESLNETTFKKLTVIENSILNAIKAQASFREFQKEQNAVYSIMEIEEETPTIDTSKKASI